MCACELVCIVLCVWFLCVSGCGSMLHMVVYMLLLFCGSGCVFTRVILWVWLCVSGCGIMLWVWLRIGLGCFVCVLVCEWVRYYVVGVVAYWLVLSCVCGCV